MDRRANRPRAIVVGGSASGLLAAAFLRQIGWRADVYEKSEVELVGRGAGIVCHPELIESLEASGAGAEDLGVQVVERVAFDHDGGVIARRPFPQTVTSWDRLHRLGRAVVPDEFHHLGHEFIAAEQMGHGVRARFANGVEVEGDLLVGADGIRSAVRRLIAPEISPLYSGYVVWRGLADEAALPPPVRDMVFDRFTFHVPEGNEIIGYPIAGRQNDLRPGHRRYNWVWYRTISPAALAEMLTDAGGVRYEFGMPPSAVRRDVIDGMRRDAEAIVAPPLLEVLRRIERPFFTPIYDLAVPRFADGRIVLVGDAAVVARPHVGLGTTKAAADARALAASLAAGAGDIDAGLAAYERNRRPVGIRCLERARLLGTWLTGESPASAAERAEWSVLHSPEGMLRHIASDEFLKSRPVDEGPLI